LTPSAVWFDDDAVVVGKEAAKNSVLDPQSYAECFKRDMGSGFYRRLVRGQQVHPEVLSAFVIDRLRRDAEQRLGPIRDVVITVPAFFDELRRKATQDAGRLAGLNVLDIINEPTAAALAFGHQHGLVQRASGAPMRILIYDLGGGTFDVTILEISGRTFRTLATDGDVCLGGIDFDERLVNQIAEKFLAAHGVDPRSDPQDAMQLWHDAEAAKHSLSECAKTSVVCFHAGIRMRIEVTRAEFEDLTSDLLERTRSTTSQAVRQAGLTWQQIDRVLLVGGSVRMPMVAAMLATLSGSTPDRSASPDEAVAHGAALYAGMLHRGRTGTDDQFELINVNSHSLGVIGTEPSTKRQVSVVLVSKNTPLPHHAAKRFKTSKDNLRTVELSIVEGESSRPEECIALGKCVVRDLPPGLPKGTEVMVEFNYEANGRLSVLARVPRTRQSAQVQIMREQQHNLADLNHWRSRLCLRTSDAFALPFATAGHANDQGGGHASTMKRLDALFTKVGQSAAGGKVPPALESCQRTAIDALKEWASARDVLQAREFKRNSSTGRTEAMLAMTELSQARLSLQQAQARAGFALVVLGRECEKIGFVPDGAARELREIKRLKTQLSQP
jgi:molecular chaperone DnaK